MLRALAGVLATAAALNPGATTRRQLGAGLAGGGLALVAAPPAFAEVLDIPPATTKMGGLLEKYADVARGARKLRRSPARRRRGAGATAGRYGRARTAAPSPRPTSLARPRRRRDRTSLTARAARRSTAAFGS